MTDQPRQPDEQRPPREHKLLCPKCRRPCADTGAILQCDHCTVDLFGHEAAYTFPRVEALPR